MALEVQDRAEPTVTSLVSGILSDAQDLFKQQIRLARQEIETDLRKSKEAVSFFAIGWTICLMGAFSLCLMTAHLLNWLGAPQGVDPSSIPLWAGYALVSGICLGAGGMTLLMGKKKVDDMGTPLHETAQALKENIEWKTNPN